MPAVALFSIFSRDGVAGAASRGTVRACVARLWLGCALVSFMCRALAGSLASSSAFQRAALTSTGRLRSLLASFQVAGGRTFGTARVGAAIGAAIAGLASSATSGAGALPMITGAGVGGSPPAQATSKAAQLSTSANPKPIHLAFRILPSMERR
jgi:hypothetical protein